MQKKGFKSDWLGHAKKEELDESALNTTKTSKVCKLIRLFVKSVYLYYHYVHFRVLLTCAEYEDTQMLSYQSLHIIYGQFQFVL